jgi:hypothetical protein
MVPLQLLQEAEKYAKVCLFLFLLLFSIINLNSIQFESINKGIFGK